MSDPTRPLGPTSEPLKLVLFFFLISSMCGNIKV